VSYSATSGTAGFSGNDHYGSGSSRHYDYDHGAVRSSDDYVDYEAVHPSDDYDDATGCDRS
jgi:hypothetical protein